jgi:hypothetical protein
VASTVPERDGQQASRPIIMWTEGWGGCQDPWSKRCSTTSLHTVWRCLQFKMVLVYTLDWTPPARSLPARLLAAARLWPSRQYYFLVLVLVRHHLSIYGLGSFFLSFLLACQQPLSESIIYASSWTTSTNPAATAALSSSCAGAFSCCLSSGSGSGSGCGSGCGGCCGCCCFCCCCRCC